MKKKYIPLLIVGYLVVFLLGFETNNHLSTEYKNTCRELSDKCLVLANRCTNVSLKIITLYNETLAEELKKKHLK